MTAVREAGVHEGWEAAAGIVELHWDNLAATDPDQLLAAVKALPGEAFIRRPGLLIAANHLEHVAAGGRSSRVHPAMELIRPTFADQALLDRLIALTSDSAVARTHDDAQRASAIAEDALLQLEAAPLAEVAAIAVSLAHLLIQWARSFDAADAPRTRMVYERAYEVACTTGQLRVARRTAAQAAWFHAENGRLDLATLWIGRAEQKDVTDDRYDAPLYITKALLRTDKGDFSGAKARLEEADAVGLGEYWAAALWVHSLQAHNVADAAITELRLASYIEEHPNGLETIGSNGRLLRACRARVLFLRGRTIDDPEKYASYSFSDRAIAASVAHLRHRDHEAMQLSQPLIASSAQPRLQATALLIHASAALALGYRDTAAHEFRRADALIQHAGLHTAYETIDSAELEQLIAISGSETAIAVRIESARRDLPNLTRRENDVLALLATDLTTARIAALLFVSPNTLKTMTRRLYRKLDVTSRKEAADYAYRAGFLSA